jgi:hypothetical protein
MRKNYYGRRRWNSNNNKNNGRNFNKNNHSNSAFAKHKELLDRASKTDDLIEKIKLIQSAEHWLKVSKEE